MMPRQKLLVVLAGLLAPTVLRAQSAAFVGSEEEHYLRWLQLAEITPRHQWSLRPFSYRELHALLPPDSGHPWDWRLGGQRTAHRSQLTVAPLPFTTRLSVNSSFPWGYNDGPVWQGRGLNSAISGGLVARWGPLSLTLAPVAFWAQNATFELQDNGRTDSLRFADAVDPVRVDAFQRPGDDPYGQVDLGQSTVRVDLPLVALGVSTANQWWSPASDQPLILGNNAAGFAHLFAGSSEPWDVGVGRMHGRILWGDLRQSDWTRNLPPTDRRLSSGLVGVFEPASLPGLEVGGARFLHERWPEGGLSLSDLKRPLGGLFRSDRLGGADPRDPGSDPQNQLAAVWMRWSLPGTGFEFHAEYAKEDDNWDLRDFVGEPENSGGYTLGLRKLWGVSETGFWGIEIEHMDLRPSGFSLGRTWARFYHNVTQRQGHTEQGQLLGSALGTGGLSTRLALERYHRNGRWSVHWQRALRQDLHPLALDTNQFGRQTRRVTRYDPEGYDIIHALGAEAVVFRGALTLSGGMTAMYEFNRYLEDDAFNLHAWVGASWRPGDTPRRWRASLTSDRTRAPEKPSITSTDVEAVGFDLSGPEAGRTRLAHLLGSEDHGDFLLRSLSSRRSSRPTPGTSLSVVPIAPQVRFVGNTALPFSLNDGSLWAGAGSNVLAVGGFRADLGPLSVIVAPEITWSQNDSFEMPDVNFIPLPLPPNRDSLSSPWYIRPGSIDLPVRFGSESFADLHPGQSTIMVHGTRFAAGVSTENQWWGPGIRNAIVLSDNAPGFPHFFVRTEAPLETTIGEFEGRWLVGGLGESDYFDSDPSNDVRSISALGLTWQPKWVPGLTLGVTRAVYAPVGEWSEVPLDFFDAVFSFPGRPNDRPLGDSTQTPGPDQIYSWFGRWVFPQAGFELYGEFAKTEFPSSIRDVFISPGHTLGYTLGFQWAKPLSRTDSAPVLRLQAEHTWLEKSSTFRQKPVGTYYTSPAVIQGYTNDGQVLGAAIGPGSSSHWLAIDYVAAKWEFGLFGGRIRWNNDALYSVPLDISPFLSLWCMHDVSLFAGARGGYRGSFGSIAATVTTGTRYNVHFQNTLVCGRDFRPEQATDIRNTTLSLTYSLPFWR